MNSSSSERELKLRTGKRLLQFRKNLQVIASICIETALDDSVGENARRAVIDHDGDVENRYVNIDGDVFVTGGADCSIGAVCVDKE